MSVKVKIGHAVHDENGHSTGGKPGDQTGREVYIADWYLIANSPWTTVFRPKKEKTANKIAAACIKACKNDNIGYDQNQRTTLYTLAKANGWQLDKVGACETDCSALVAVLCNAAGITVSKDMYTGNEKEVLTKTGKFEVFTDDDHCLIPDNLKKGDILLKKGHTATVIDVQIVEDEIIVKKAKNAPASKDESLKGTYEVVNCDALNMRHGAGSGNDILVTIKGGSTVTCEGEYTSKNGTKWLYVTYTNKNYMYIGFCSSKYLKKVTPTTVATDAPAKKDANLEGTYICTADSLTIRNGAGKDNKAMAYVYKNETVTCDGSYTEVDGTKWLYIKAETTEMNYIGFASSRYLKKV